MCTWVYRTWFVPDHIHTCNGYQLSVYYLCSVTFYRWPGAIEHFPKYGMFTFQSTQYVPLTNMHNYFSSYNWLYFLWYVTNIHYVWSFDHSTLKKNSFRVHGILACRFQSYCDWIMKQLSTVHDFFLFYHLRVQSS